MHINAGTVQVGGPSALPTGVMLGFNGGSLDLNEQARHRGRSRRSSGTILDNGADFTTMATFTVDQAVNTTYGGTITNGLDHKVALTKSGSGALTLTGGNTFSGP